MDGLVSVIVPIYNSEKYLNTCLNSISGQIYLNIEIILINDGSTDGSLSICNEFLRNDKRVKLFNIHNQGVSNARNIGLENSNGEYIMFIDADDWIDENTISESVQAMTRDKSDILFFSYKKVSNKSTNEDNYLVNNVFVINNIDILKRRVVGFSNEPIKEPTKTDAFNTPWAKLYKKSVIGDIKYVERSKVGMEDVLFNIEVVNSASKCSFLNKYFYNYRLDNPYSLTKIDTQNLYSKFEKFFLHIENSKFYKPEYHENLQNRVSCSLINICLSLTHKNNRMGLLSEWKYLNGILISKRYSHALYYFSLRGLPIHWRIFFSLAKNKMTTLLLGLSYVMRVLK